jgi:hypothetical protein
MEDEIEVPMEDVFEVLMEEARVEETSAFLADVFLSAFGMIILLCSQFPLVFALLVYSTARRARFYRRKEEYLMRATWVCPAPLAFFVAFQVENSN